MSTQNTVLAQLDSHTHSSELPAAGPITPPRQTETFRRGGVRAAFVPDSDKHKELTSSRERVRARAEYLVTLSENKNY